MIRFYSYTFLVLLFCLTSCYKVVILSDAQDRKAATDMCIVMRVQTNGKKIRYLNHQLNTLKAQGKSYDKTLALLEKTMQSDSTYLSVIQAAFRDHFQWSKVYFVPDTLYKDLLAGKKNVCLNINGKMDYTIMAPDNYFLITTPDHREQLVLTDKEGIKLPAPYPYKKNTLFPAFRRIFEKEQYIYKQITYFNDRLSQAKYLTSNGK